MLTFIARLLSYPATQQLIYKACCMLVNLKILASYLLPQHEILNIQILRDYTYNITLMFATIQASDSSSSYDQFFTLRRNVFDFSSSTNPFYIQAATTYHVFFSRAVVEQQIGNFVQLHYIAILQCYIFRNKIYCATEGGK